MVATIQIHGSGGSVLAPLGSRENLVETKRTPIRVIRTVNDKEISLGIRQVLVGMQLSAVFMGVNLNRYLSRSFQVNPGAAFVYMGEIIEQLEQQKKIDEESILQLRDTFSQLDLLQFLPEDVEVLV